ncbi:glutamate--tRNA ligase [bacterium]|jgi:nondiscriminating glutamyl-tRNA synthetase|nr:glutamate--tRNA ligase [bacterium]
MKRVRFAPSPTGNLHIGTLRTALFNWLFAKRYNATYVLRIEDTDKARSKPEYEDNIYEGMDWMEIVEDEGPKKGGKFGPYRQTERIVEGIYQKQLNRLLEEKKAYYCFCTDKDLDAEREEAKQKNRPYIYSRKCLRLNPDEIADKLNSEISRTVKFEVPDTKSLIVSDGVRDDIDFDCSLISDFVLLKSDGNPSYNYSVVVDDALMEITDVIRGEDHISNTPKQLLLFKALGFTPPQYHHLPMILGQDKSKLSKRHGATAVTDYESQGYLSDALYNFLALLGWSPTDTTEIFDRASLSTLFSMDRISKSNAVFDVTKLKWMNGQYIRSLSESALSEKVKPFLDDASNAILAEYSESDVSKIIYSVRDNLALLPDINGYLESFNTSFESFSEKVKGFQFTDSERQVVLDFCKNILEYSDITSENVSKTMDIIVEKNDGKKGKVFKPIRKALIGLERGPNIVEILTLLGRENLSKRASFLNELFSV